MESRYPALWVVDAVVDWSRASLHIIVDGQGVMRERVFTQVVQGEGKVSGIGIAREGESGMHCVVDTLLE